MKIGIDCRKFYDVANNRGAGIERYTYHLVKSLLIKDKTNDYVLFFYTDISPDTVQKVKSHNPRVKIVKLFRATSMIPLYDTHIKIAMAMRKEKLDWHIFPANAMPLFFKPKKSLLIVHDLAIYLHPEWFPERQWLSTKIVVPRSIKKATKIVTVSKNTKDDVVGIFNTKSEKVHAVYPGVIIKDDYLPEEIDKVRKKYDISEKYLLFLGTIEPRKNIVNLIKAFSNYSFDNEESRVTLILAGIKGWKFQPIFQELQEINQRLIGGKIKYIGQVSNRERNILIKNCQAFVFPSQYEGFGFPVVEAMALGVPVVTGNNSSLKEIAENAALLVDPNDINDIRNAIRQIVSDKYLRNHLVLKGKERIKKFTWEDAVNKIIGLLD